MAYAFYYSFDNLDNFSIGVILTVLLRSLVALRWRTKEATIPIVNSYRWDMTLKIAHAEFISNARGLIKEGVQKAKSLVLLQKGMYTY
jgi:hypothetical protein